ncbi:MAG: DNA polymerase III subunit gamma/tau [Peptococcaceae bacterium]|nr:DNA polymerase III subunit gamma/tau [Peptococcaceae bacterium]
MALLSLGGFFLNTEHRTPDTEHRPMYMALYRQWRPKSFADIVGQEHVRLTLTHALNENKVAHAYLFSGPRGTGKTTVARLLAKSLNCGDRQGVESCQVCSSCREIDQGAALDVVEIDAASNRGIDEIRDLREKVRLAAAGGRYKVYIIDEVHMLTAEAFNALLKTLEDPPEGVVFVLATTEAHRVPATILSRVQHFEFRRIAVKDIEERLRLVCDALERDVADEALRVIALKSEGGLRDALSMLDQCLNQEGRLGAEDILRQLGMMGESGSAGLVEGLLRESYADLLRQMDENMALGRDPRQILRELLDYLRDMMIFLAGDSLTPRVPEAAERLGRQAKEAGLARVLAWIHLLLKGEGELKYAPNARLAVEMLLVQAVYAGVEEKQGSDKGHKQPADKRSVTDKGTAAVRAPVNKKSVGDKGSVTGADTLSVTTENSGGTAGQGGGGQASQEQKTSAKTQGSRQKLGEGDAFAVSALRESEVPGLPEFTIKKWEEIVGLIRRRSKPVHAFLLAGEPHFVEGKVWVVFPHGFSFHCEMLNQEINKKIMMTAVREVMGREVPVEGIVGPVAEMSKAGKAGYDSAGKSPDKTGSSETSSTGAGLAGTSAQRDAAAAVDALEKAVEIFGSDIVVVREDG